MLPVGTATVPIGFTTVPMVCSMLAEAASTVDQERVVESPWAIGFGDAVMVASAACAIDEIANRMKKQINTKGILAFSMRMTPLIHLILFQSKSAKIELK